MTPARFTPDPKTYWFAVPRGQSPPPTVDEPVAQIWPSEKIRHCTRFTVKMFSALAKRRNPRPGFGFATASEAEALLGRYAVEGLLDASMVAVVKRGPQGATVLAREGDRRLRFEVATTPVTATDTTGAGDAFDAGFLVGWFTSRAAGRALPASLQRAAIAGHRAAARQLTSTRPELPLA